MPPTMVPPRGAVHRGVATPLAGQQRLTTIARLPACPASHPTATTNYNGNDVPPPRYGNVPTDGFTAGMAIGNSGTGGGGSSATGTHQPDDCALSRGDMAKAHLNLRWADATPGDVPLQGGTSTGASAHQTHGPNQRHHHRLSTDDAAFNVDQQSNAGEGDQALGENQTHPNDEGMLPPDSDDGENAPNDPLPFPRGDPGPDRPPTPLDMERTFPGPRRASKGKRKKRTKASTLVAALNIKGIGNPNPWHPKHKWYHVNQLMKDNKLGLLVVGESHLSAVRHNSIQNLFGRRLEIIFSEDPETPNARGLAFVINKDMLNTDDIQTWEIIPSRAMVIKLETYKNETMVVLGVYAPNPPADNARFWERLRVYFENNPNTPRPDIMGGDTNIVEEAIDRLPTRTDPENATKELDLLLTSLQLVDGWRKTYPNTRAYTYIHQGGRSQSRLDRIYIRRDKYLQAYDWQIKTPGIPTDHRMVSVRITRDAAPTTGPGRWVWPTHIVRDKEVSNFIHTTGMATQETARRMANWPERDPALNIHTI
ncbi:Endonuclease/exonuclease/phosphatase [Mycena sanguinolenta]|nr:Endonuclease/exonuclease/phosphatase [Mycena sanguinolenta]